MRIWYVMKFCTVKPGPPGFCLVMHKYLYYSMTAALEGGQWSAARPGRTYRRKRPGTHFIGGWVGPRAGLDGRKISSPPGFYPGPSSPQSIVIPSTDYPIPTTDYPAHTVWKKMNEKGRRVRDVGVVETRTLLAVNALTYRQVKIQ